MTSPTSLECVGIDVAKKEVVVHWRQAGQTRAFPRTEEGLADLASELQGLPPGGQIVVEATGGYSRRVVQVLTEHGLAVAHVNAQRVRQFAKARGTDAKTDPLDAAVLAHFAEAFDPPAQPAATLARQRLQELTKRRDQVVTDLTRLTTQEEHFRDPRVLAGLRQSREALKRELKALDQDRDALIRTEPEFTQIDTLLQSVPGIGPVVSSTFLAEVPELGRGDSAGLVRLVGLAPITQQSGGWQGQARIRGGRAAPRRAVYMAVISAISYNPLIRAYYFRLLARGKAKKVALIACARKLVRIMHAMVRDGTRWEDRALVPT